MKTHIVPLFLLIVSLSSAQIEGKIIDKITKEPIPYVNVWVEDEPYGTTSNEYGIFQFTHNKTFKTIVFSAIGYETKKVKWKSISQVIMLVSQETILDEIVINSKKETIEKVIEKFKRSRINKFFGCGEKPKIWARFFPYSDSYSETPYLKKIKVFSIIENKNTKFNIRFYTADSLGRPDKYLYNQNIIGIAKKGNKITQIDVSGLDISIPETGFFIALEWLIIEDNKYEYKYKEEKTKKKLIAIGYDPRFGTIAEETNQNSWSFTEGNWKRVPEDLFGDLKEKDTKKYSLLAIELTLSN